MTLTLLRRLVAAGAVLSFGAAGGAAWFALQAEASVRPAEEWSKVFPAEKRGAPDVGHQTPGPNPEYLAVLWVQGEKPKKVDPNAKAPEAPKVDPFQFRLVCVVAAPRLEDSSAQIQPLNPAGAQAFSIQVGTRVPDPAVGDGKTLLPWRLEWIRLPEGEEPPKALFRNLDTDEEKTLAADMLKPNPLAILPGTEGGKGALFAGSPRGVPPENQPSRFLTVAADRAKGEFEIEVPEEEQEYLATYSDKEAAKVSVVPAKDAAGNPSGFVIKGLAQDSRARDAGFKSEDRVISVNGEKVDSPEQAVSAGKRQYREGATTFVVRIERAGREMNITYRAPKKRGGGKN